MGHWGRVSRAANPTRGLLFLSFETPKNLQWVGLKFARKNLLAIHRRGIGLAERRHPANRTVVFHKRA